MMRRLRWSLALVLVLLLAYSGASWWAGQRAENLIRHWVADVNARWADQSNGLAPPALAVQHVDRGIYSSQVRYLLQYPDGTQTRDFGLQSHLQHGPWPWRRVLAGHWQPLAASSTLEPLPGGAWQPWFDGVADHQLPWVLQADIGFQGHVQANVQFPSAQLAGQGLSLGAGQIHLTHDPDLARVEVSAHVSSMGVDDPALGLAFEFKDLDYQSHVALDDGAQARQFHQQLRIQQFLLLTEQAPGLLFVGPVLSMDAARTGRLVDALFEWDLGQLQVGDHSLGELRLRGRVEQLDEQAWQALGQALDELPEGDPDHWPESERDKLMARLAPVLATSPVLTLDAFSWRTPDGTSEAAARVQLQPLGDKPQWALQDGLRAVSLRVGLSRAMVLYLVRQTQAENPQMAVALASMLFDRLSAQLQRQGLVRLTEGRVELDYQFEDGESRLNDAPVSPQELGSLLSKWGSGAIELR